MNLSPELISQGFAIDDVKIADLDDYIIVKRVCYKKYVDEYFGGWVEDDQIKMNTDGFFRFLNNTCFKKLLRDNKTAGFFSYNELEDKIGGITIQMLEAARNKGVGSFYLKHITELSDKTDKPVFLKVFKSNPARNL